MFFQVSETWDVNVVYQIAEVVIKEKMSRQLPEESLFIVFQLKVISKINGSEIYQGKNRNQLLIPMYAHFISKKVITK